MRRLELGPALFHGMVLAGAFALLGRTLALPLGVIAGASGALLGSLVAEVLDQRRLRLLPTLLLAGALAVAAFQGSAALLAADWPARGLGLRAALEWADAVRLGGGVFAGVLALRAVEMRIRAMLVIEVALVVAAVAMPVAAHRDGMIARPLAIADWFWRQGLDPVLAFLGLGLVGVVLVAGTLARGRRPLRTLGQLLVVAILGGAVAMSLHHRSAEATLRPPGGQGGGDRDDARGEGGGGSGDRRDRPGTAENELEDQQEQGERGQQRPVAVVVFHKDVQPFTGVFYFRHAAFSQFNGARLVEATRPDVDRDAPWRFPTAKRVLPGPPEGTPARSSVATDVALITEHRRMFALTDPVEIEPMLNPAPARFKRAYRVVSSVVSGSPKDLIGHAAGDSGWTPEIWAHYTAMPDDPRYLELAARIDARLKDEFRGDPMARALAVKSYLEETTIYSFARRYGGEEPTAEFLFSEGDRKGYCTHIAHAAAFLLRAMGVPSRVSAGYGVMADNLRGGSALLVKSGDAHAWVEVHLGDIGWVPIEIVPERTEFEPAPFQEEDLQRLLGEMARDEGRQTVEAEGEGELARLLQGLLRALPWMLALLVAGAYAIRGIRWLRPWLAPEAVGWAYRASLDRLAAAGWTRRRGESRQRFAQRVAEVAPSLATLTRLLEARVLGGHPGGRAPGGRSAAAVAAEVGRELRDRLPGWRRFLAAVHPAPWWWSR